MTTAREFLDRAVGEIGYVDSRYRTGGPYPPAQRSKYGDAFGDGFRGAWCLRFVRWLLREFGMEDMPTDYVPTSETIARQRGIHHEGIEGIRPGDIVLWDFTGPDGDDHTSVFESWSGGDVVSIDGNTSDWDAANGGTVARRIRDASLVGGYWRPAFSEATPAPQPTPTPEEDPIVATSSPVQQDHHFPNLYSGKRTAADGTVTYAYEVYIGFQNKGTADMKTAVYLTLDGGETVPIAGPLVKTGERGSIRVTEQLGAVGGSAHLQTTQPSVAEATSYRQAA